jgi:hypothetical protein
MTNAVDDAKATLAALQDKLTAAKAASAKITEDAKAVSFDAFTSGGEARKKLDKLEAERLSNAVTISSLESAIDEAKRRLAHAEALAADEAEKEKARTVLGLLDDFAKRGAQLDAALHKFVSEYDELSRDFHRLEALGYGPTSFALVQINMAAAVTTRLQFTDLRQGFLAPHARRNFITVIEGWAANVRARASARLKRNAPAKIAA